MQCTTEYAVVTVLWRITVERIGVPAIAKHRAQGHQTGEHPAQREVAGPTGRLRHGQDARRLEPVELLEGGAL